MASIAILSRESADSPSARFVVHAAQGLVDRGFEVHLFTERGMLAPAAPGVPSPKLHDVGEAQGSTLVDKAEDFAVKVRTKLDEVFIGPDAMPVAVLACEWGAIPALAQLGSGFKRLLILSSVERQRSDMRRELNMRIELIEIAGIQAADSVICRDEAVAAKIAQIAPSAAAKLTSLGGDVPVQLFDTVLDPGYVKRQHEIGPVDPTILFIGEMEDRNGPDLLMKAIPIVSKKYKQARFILVGDGELLWPMRVYSRYLFLDGIVRVPGHLGGQDLRDLIQASDVVVIPARSKTSDWSLRAAWAAKKPAVVTREAGLHLAADGRNAILIPPSEKEIAEALDRLLSVPGLGASLGAAGYEQFNKTEGWALISQQLTALVQAASPASGPAAVLSTAINSSGRKDL